MKKLLMTTALLAAVGASPAWAANSALTIWNDSNPGGSVTATGTDTAVISSSSLNGITITSSGVDRATAPNGMTESNFFVRNTTGSTQVLDILAGTNGFIGPSNLFNATATIELSSGTADLTGMFFVDNGNSLNGQNTGPVVGTQIGGAFNSGLLTGPFSFSSNSPDVPFGSSNLYGMAEELQLTLGPHAFLGVQSISMNATNAVPEPSTWAMMLGGFGLLGIFGLRKRRVSRFAV